MSIYIILELFINFHDSLQFYSSKISNDDDDDDILYIFLISFNIYSDRL